jgi:hypothetical protein
MNNNPRHKQALQQQSWVHVTFLAESQTGNQAANQISKFEI